MITDCALNTQLSSEPSVSRIKPKELFTSQLPYMDLTFSLTGKTVPLDHGYELFSAIAHFQPLVHELNTIGIHTIAGIPEKDVIYLNKNSKLRIRLRVNQVRLVYRLACKSLKIGKHTIRLGIPDICLLQPAEKLRSRIVTIKGYEEAEEFLAAAQRQFEQLGIGGKLIIPKNTNSLPKRRSIKIKRFTVVGFSLEATNLSEEDSLLLQMYGVGGKRKMGCGLFVPLRERISQA